MGIDPVGDRAPEDLTARARIRDAALRLFAERGIAAATIRDIAKAAGVSSGLVRHHFGSKEALRDACDSYAMDWMDRIRLQMLAEGRVADVAFVASMNPTILLLQTYLTRSMMDGSESAATLFDRMVEQGEQWFTRQGTVESADPHAYTTVLVAMLWGVYAMRDEISRTLGVDAGTAEGSTRINRAFVEIFSQPMFTPELTAQLRTALDRYQEHLHDRGAQDARTKE